MSRGRSLRRNSRSDHEQGEELKEEQPEQDHEKAEELKE